MNTGVAHLIALAAYGNWALHSATTPDLTENSSVQHVGELAFIARSPEDHVRGESVSRTMTQWYAMLRAQGVVRLALSRIPVRGWSLRSPYDLAAFDTQEHGVIVAAGPNGRTELWVPEWRVVDGLAPDRRIWGVTYRASKPPLLERFRVPAPAAAIATLDAALEEIAGFSSGNHRGEWVEWFARAARLLRGQELEPPFFPDLFPPVGYSPEARRLLSACVAAWPFGGMGSWNDSAAVAIVALPRYRTVSKKLYNALMDGIVAAANAFEAPARVDGSIRG